VTETEKLRDINYNMLADYHRKKLIMENEKGGIFDRTENSGVKNMFIPASQDYTQM
jgi:hypothetical protein